MNTYYQIDLKFQKNEIFNPDTALKSIYSLDKRKYYLYNLDEEDIKGEIIPTKILQKNFELRFFENIPIKDEGYALLNKIAGIEPSKKDQRINFISGKVNYMLDSKNLKDYII